MSAHDITFGSLDLTGTVVTDYGATFLAITDGHSWGSPQAETSVVRSMMADGDLVEWDRDGNRQIELTVRIEAQDGIGLALAEADLARETRKPNTVKWTPPTTWGMATSVYVVLTSHMEALFDNALDLQSVRTYRLVLTCAPYARSANLTTVAALEDPDTATTVTVDTCDSATGWTGTRSGEPLTPSTAWQAGSVGVAELDQDVTSPETWTLTRTGSINFSTTPYLVVQVRTLAADVGQPMDVTAAAHVDSASGSDRMILPTIAITKTVDSSYFEVVYDATGLGVVPALTFSHTSTKGHVWQGLYVRNIARTNVPPARTSRQSHRLIPVGGTERTPGTLHVQTADGTGSTGLTMVHTSKDDRTGYAPDLMRHRVSGNTQAAEPLSPSGWSEPIHPDPVISRLPASMVPSDGYWVCAWLKSDTTGDVPIWWSARTIPPGMPEDGGVGGRVVHKFTITGWEFVVLGMATLPTVDTNQGEVQFDIQLEAGGSASVKVGEWWYFRAGEGSALTVVTNPHPHLWLSSSEIGGAPKVEVGTDQARTHPGTHLLSMGDHIFNPEGISAFLITADPNAKLDASFYKQWPHNAPE